MKAVIQRVKYASVCIENQKTAAIEQGLLVLLGIENADTQADAEWLTQKITQLRIFSDTNGLMNLSVQDINGSVLVVSQFTLHASTKKGNRPSFIKAAKPDYAIPLYEKTLALFKNILSANKIQSGTFGADMQIELLNDGPVTIIIDTQQKE